MNGSLFLDTAYILALLNSYDGFHLQARKLSSEIDVPLVTTEAILTEIGNALAKPQWRELAVDTVNDLRADESVEIIQSILNYSLGRLSFIQAVWIRTGV